MDRLQHYEKIETSDGMTLTGGHALTVEVTWNDSFLRRAKSNTPNYAVVTQDDIVETIAGDISGIIDGHFEFDEDELNYFNGDEDAALESRYEEDGSFEVDDGDMRIRVNSFWGLNGGALAFGYTAANAMRPYMDAPPA